MREDMVHVCMGTMALSLERMVTRDTVRELETTVKAGASGGEARERTWVGFDPFGAAWGQGMFPHEHNIHARTLTQAVQASGFRGRV